MLLVFGFFMGFSSVAISDTIIESWMAVKPKHLMKYSHINSSVFVKQ